MPASRRLVISAATRTPFSFFWKSAIAAAIFFCALLANGFRSRWHFPPALSADAARRAGSGAEQSECGFGFDRELDIGQPQGLPGLVERGPPPDMHIGLAAQSEEALLLLCVHQQRNQQPVAGCRDAARLTVTSTEPEPSSGKVFPANCAWMILLISVKGMSIGTPMRHRPGVGGTMTIVAGNGQWAWSRPE